MKVAFKDGYQSVTCESRQSVRFDFNIAKPTKASNLGIWTLTNAISSHLVISL